MGSAVLGLVSGVLGSFAVLKRQSLLGDGVSHAALPGVVLAFLLTGSKRPEAMLIGALGAGLCAALLITLIVRHTHVRFDGALALVMSVFFGLGMVLLTYAQKMPDASHAGLKRFLYGQASALLPSDVMLMAIVGTVLIGLVLLLWKELALLAFDPQYADSLGFRSAKLGLLLSFMLVLAIVIGLQTVGVVLMSAMLIAPAVAARQWSRHLWQMVVLAAVFGALSGVMGTVFSSLVAGLPTGPAIVTCASMLAVISLLVAPGRGIIHTALRRAQNRLRLKMEGRHTDVGST